MHQYVLYNDIQSYFEAMDNLSDVNITQKGIMGLLFRPDRHRTEHRAEYGQTPDTDSTVRFTLAKGMLDEDTKMK